MTTTRKKIITIETRQRIVIRYNSRPPQKIRCAFCNTEVETAAPELSAEIFGIGLAEIYQNIENGKLHFIEGETNAPQICLNSLKTYENQEIKKYETKN